MTVSMLAMGMAFIVLAAMIVLVLAAAGLKRPRYRRTVRRRVGAAL